ncbi:MAG: ABC transporter ATP-binding protein [Proteobacteria bacterium]|nr:ABC transporter ATP-binding protein [Pseudomonadota bacterium]
MLTIESVCARYGRAEVLKMISLVVHPGEIVSIIGANGAGKTSILRAISRILPCTAGTITFNGIDLGCHSTHELISLGLSHVPEGRQIFPRLTVLENLELGAYALPMLGSRSAEFDYIFELFPVLKERLSQAAGTLSGGEQQMLAIGRALMGRPSLLLLDEPSMGVAPLLVERIFETIHRLNAGGMTILLVEQDAHRALAIASRGYVLELGVVTLTGAPQELLSNPQVQESYLGA